MRHYTFWYLVVLLGVTTLLLLTVVYFRRVYSWPSRLRSRLMSLCLAFFAVAYALLALELVAKHAFVETDAASFTLASREWMRRHWKPINRYGYRDPEYDLDALRRKRTLFVVGDSYVMGFGIRDPEDRIGNLLGRRLGRAWGAVNMARLGWGTRSELEALRSSPVEPDVILLVYVYNDFEGAAHRMGLMTDVDMYQPSRLTRAVIGKSYLLNLIYCRFYWRLTKGPQLLRAYDRFMQQSFADPGILQAHLDDVRGFPAYADRTGARLLVVVFPAFYDIEGTRALLSPVVEALEARDVPVVDLAPVFEGRPMQSLTVNSLDHHPNEAVHREVADLVHARMLEEKMLGPGSPD